MPWYRKKWGIAILVMIVVMVFLVVTVAAAIFGIITQTKTTALNVNANIDPGQLASSTDILVKTQARILAEKIDRPYFGNPNAKLVIVEFGDFMCPYTLQEFPIIRSIMSKYKNDILFIYRQYPVISDASASLALASLCAGEQGKFWQIHDKFFAEAGKITDLASLKASAQLAGVDMTKFETCLTSESIKTKVQEDYRDALELGVSGTPTFFINGHKIQGVVTTAAWDEIIIGVKKIIAGK